MTTLSPENEVSALAHQLLSPVTAAGNYAAAMATALKAGTLTPEKTADGLRRILRETERAQKTAAALKRLFRAEHPVSAPVNAVKPSAGTSATVLPSRLRRLSRPFGPMPIF